MALAQIGPGPGGGGGAPTGAAGGGLTGTYPNPGVAGFTAGAGTLTGPGTNGTALISGGALGTPASGVATNLTGTAAGLNVGGNAATATALAATPTPCSTGQAPTGILANGNSTGCAAIGGGGSPGGATGAVQFNDSAAFAGASNLTYYESLPTPSAPMVVTSGTPGMTSYGYKVAFRAPTGTGIASVETVIATGNDTLDMTNFNVISVPACSEAGVTASIYRTSAPGSYDFPYSIAEVACGGTVNDIGGPVDGSRQPQSVDTATGIYLNGVEVTQKLAMGAGAPGGLVAPFAASNTFTDLAGADHSAGYFGAIFNPAADAGAYNASVRIAAQSIAGNHFAQGLVGLITQTDYFDGTGDIIGYANYTTAQGDGSGHINNVYGTYESFLNYPATQVIDNVYGNWTQLNLQGGGAVGKLYNNYVAKPDLGFTPGTIGEAYGLWIGDQSGATNGYAFWYDGPGNVVTRIKSDGIYANYNPSFSPKYTPGGADFEREFIRWDGSNVAEIGTEAGGTGTLRPLRLVGGTLLGTAPTSCSGQPTGTLAIITVATIANIVTRCP